MDANGVSVSVHALAHGGAPANGIVQGQGTIQSSAGVGALLTSAQVADNADHKVDGSMRSSMTTPNAPTNLIATADGADKIHIAWTAPTFPGSSPISTYRVEWSTTGSAPWTLAGTATETMLDHTELTAVTTYHYRVTAINGSGNGTPSGSASATTAADLVCGRTSAIADAITAAARVASCAKVTATQLGEITKLDASDGNMTSLASGDFSGLTSVTMLDMSGNAFTSIPSGIFAPLSALTSLDLSDALDGVAESSHSRRFSSLSLTTLKLGSNGWSELPEGILIGLASLATLDLGGNTVDPLPVIVTLERVERAKFKAAIPAGAPFAATVPITVTGGTLDGTPATVTVSAGTRDSGQRTVTPANPRTGAVTVTVGTLPAKPSGHSGYVLKASEDLPITVVSAPATVTIAAETGQVLANAWDGADFTLTRTPATGTIDVDVALTETDTVMTGGPRTETVTFEDGEATASLSLILLKVPNGDATITATVQDGTDHTAGTPASADLLVEYIHPALDIVIEDTEITVEEGEKTIMHVVATTAADVDQPSMEVTMGVTVATRKATADNVDGDFAIASDELEFSREEFTQNADGRWVARKTYENQTHDDEEYEGDETYGIIMQRSATLRGTVTINGSVAANQLATITITDNEPPPPPTDVTATGTNGATIEVTWNAPTLGSGTKSPGTRSSGRRRGETRGRPWPKTPGRPTRATRTRGSPTKRRISTGCRQSTRTAQASRRPSPQRPQV